MRSNCEWCNLSEKERQWLLYETQYWTVYLADEQDYVGRCIVILNRHCGSLSELSESEWNDLKEIIDKIEYVYKESLGAQLCNWSCLMNSFFKESAPNPHLHIHVRPRYDKPVVLSGVTYTDSEFGHHYALNKSEELSVEDREEVFTRLKEWLNRLIPTCR